MNSRIKKSSQLYAPIFLAWALCIQACTGAASPEPRLIHVFVALADNENQGIVPMPAAIGNGEDPARNLYWGAAYGVRTYFRNSSDWKETSVTGPAGSAVLQRSVFVHRNSGTVMIADAYRGMQIAQAASDFFRAAAGLDPKVEGAQGTVSLAVYVGHDVLMDTQLQAQFESAGPGRRDAIVLACKSKQFFAPLLRPTGAQPLLWTTGLMAPEAYTLKAALDGWIAGEPAEEIKARAAAAYAKYQKLGPGAARSLFASGW
jgi:hypothetical protein